MSEARIIAKAMKDGKPVQDLVILPALANRHGLITGATGTGKTVTLQKMAEQFSRIGIPVFLADVKGDLSGIAAEGVPSEKLQARLAAIGVTDWQPQACSMIPWDIFGEKGHPIRATISDLGPLLLGRLLDLNEVQSGVLQLVFKIADDNALLLLDMKDLRAMVQYVGDNAKQFQTQYGNISSASVGAIQRGLLTLEQQGANQFFGEPMLDINDLMRTDANGHGIINLLAADKLINQPKLYAVFLLWLLAELFEHLPEVGDPEQPKLVFFFDEAHLLFNDAPPALLTKIEQVVRLIRSKGVGIYFVTQNPLDIPDSVLGQLGNRVQHALRAFTPRDQKAVKAAAQTMRANPEFDAETAITELGVGEALVSFLDEKGRPNVVERAMVIAPESKMGMLGAEGMKSAINKSPLYGRYEDMVDRESAYEKLAAGGFATVGTPQPGQPAQKPAAGQESGGGLMGGLNEILFGSTGPRGGKHDGIVQTAAKSMARDLGRQILRGVLGSIMGGRKK
ncbi:helicase HerA-like C-terminal domain-containing protein [Serratia fonticola]|uniref:helicase HerA-like C-terminal domain-containing protein n=1 Tax=Serratia fonticola TaxID=47917 RepID=UPI002179E0FA|nr:helicase HerA-like C-terminal domain-containing protein [Serratia fonticola]CAI1953288.1 Ornithine/acetylornithine aminotransferase [Serratia fonticola]CAI1958617.1 Ornithine/acetylornithine aminotransferase [Serratia fonticola]CAI1974790.1 Ornithine/acetylornithine aminotransferase [Serratia fonticola]